MEDSGPGCLTAAKWCHPPLPPRRTGQQPHTGATWLVSSWADDHEPQAQGASGNCGLAGPGLGSWLWPAGGWLTREISEGSFPVILGMGHWSPSILDNCWETNWLPGRVVAPGPAAFPPQTARQMWLIDGQTFPGPLQSWCSRVSRTFGKGGGCGRGVPGPRSASPFNQPFL